MVITCWFHTKSYCYTVIVLKNQLRTIDGDAVRAVFSLPFIQVTDKYKADQWYTFN